MAIITKTALAALKLSQEADGSEQGQAYMANALIDNLNIGIDNALTLKGINFDMPLGGIDNTLVQAVVYDVANYYATMGYEVVVRIDGDQVTSILVLWSEGREVGLVSTYLEDEGRFEGQEFEDEGQEFEDIPAEKKWYQFF